jgi:hypothetical protein
MEETPPVPPDDSGKNRDASGRFQKGCSGNRKGRPKGRRNRLTEMSDHVAPEDLSKIIVSVVDRAKRGSLQAAKAIFDYCLEPRPRDPVASFALPKLKTAEDAVRAIAAIAKAAADGELSPAEAKDMADLVTRFVAAVEASEFEARLAALEEQNRGAE